MTEENTGLPTEKNIEDYELLEDMLHSQKKEFDLLSKKKADGQLNPMKIKIGMGDVRAEIALAMHILHERPPFLWQDR